MKIIFLDIDGVLNFQGMQDSVIVKNGKLSKSCVKNMNELTDNTGAKIVISSTWRKDSFPASDALKEGGVTGEIIGSTPIYNQRNVFRGNEIYGWMQDNQDLIECYPASFNSYVILDDDSDMLLWQANNFINTDAWSGLTESAAYKAKRVLNSRCNL